MSVGQHKIAISFAEENAWVARDLDLFLAECGFTAFCSKTSTGTVNGILKNDLRAIYNNSLVNVLIYSKEYKSKVDKQNSIVNFESTILHERHVKNKKESSLFILKIDDTEVLSTFNGLVYDNITDCGLHGARKSILSRLRTTLHCSGRADYDSVAPIHPPGLEKLRGALRPCKFKILPGYKKDRLNRWKNIGDIEVEIIYSGHTYEKNYKVYLIPSGRVSFISNSVILKNNTDSLNLKKVLSTQFTENFANQTLNGQMYLEEKGEAKLPTIYSALYDKFLIDGQQ